MELVLYGRQSEAPAPGLTVNRLPDLPPEGFDLILDGQFLTAGMANFSPDRLDNLVTGPAARFLKTWSANSRSFVRNRKSTPASP